MAKTQTTPEVIEKFRKKHGEKYDYSKVDFQGSHTKVTIICPDHGEFQQTPAIHIRKSGCPECGKNTKGKKRRLSPEAWIEKARAVHGDRYDYTPTVYTVNRSKVTINCRIHGAFEILPDNHLKGSGCRICGLSSERKLQGFDPTEEFRAVHGDRYDYSEFVYKGSHEGSTIVCPEHGPFEQSYYVHKSGHGCPGCGRAATIEGRTYTLEEILDRFLEVHGDRYDYSKVKYEGARQGVTIICPDHGEFQQTPYSHFSGAKCPRCSSVERGRDSRKTHEWFLEQTTRIYGDRYDYSKARYEHSKRPVIVVCKIHGEFQITPAAHIHDNCGCPRCSSVTSNAELDVADFVESLGFEVIRNNRSLIGPKEIDIYIPNGNLAIEYCGLYWHGEQSGKDQSYHQSKMELLNQKGIDLITIFEDEWLGKPEVVKTIIRTRLGKSPQGVGGRKLTIRDVSPSDSREFLNLHHIQGAATGSVHLGAYDGDKLVGLMLFGNPTRQTSSYEWELKRFVTNGKIYPGMMSKLFGYFIKTYHPESIVSFSDNRWFNGNSYGQLGFHKDGEIASDYYYHRLGIRYNKSRFRKAGIQRYHPEIYDENLTERVMMEMAGYDRIWDCGKIRWVWIDPDR